MGDLVYLDQRRRERCRRAAGAPPAFFFDVACPESYLTAERIERTLGAVEWIPAPSPASSGELGESQLTARYERAQARAFALRLPLVWPEKLPTSSRRALRAATRASECGAGARFALALSRLRFCGGYDLEDVEALAGAAAAAGLALDDCLAAAGDRGRDRGLEATAAELRSCGVRELPAIRVHGRWFAGPGCLPAAAAALRAPVAAARPRGVRRGLRASSAASPWT